MLFILAVSALAAENLRSAKFPAVLKPEKGKEVRIALEDNAAHAVLPSGQKQRLTDYDSANDASDAPPLLVADFNFDGHEDVAVLEQVSAGGTSDFYRVWLWNSAAQKYREFETSISNPSLSAKNRTLVSAQPAGPRWQQTVFRAEGGELKVFLQSVMLATAKHWGVTYADGTRAVAGSAWFDGDMQKRPQATAVYDPSLCSREKKPGKKSRKERPAKVQLIDFREDGAEVLIRDKKTPRGRWVSADCLASE
jgi:hypothetical protein